MNRSESLSPGLRPTSPPPKAGERAGRGGASWRALISVLLALAGCAHSQSEADLVIINGAEPESLDPAVLTGEADGRVALELFAGLTRYNPTDATPVPDLAESWDLSADGKVYTFH